MKRPSIKNKITSNLFCTSIEKIKKATSDFFKTSIKSLQLWNSDLYNSDLADEEERAQQYASAKLASDIEKRKQNLITAVQSGEINIGNSQTDKIQNRFQYYDCVFQAAKESKYGAVLNLLKLDLDKCGITKLNENLDQDRLKKLLDKFSCGLDGLDLEKELDRSLYFQIITAVLVNKNFEGKIKLISLTNTECHIRKLCDCFNGTENEPLLYDMIENLKERIKTFNRLGDDQAGTGFIYEIDFKSSTPILPN